MARGAAGSIGVTPGQWERAAGRHWALTKANTFSTIEIPASLRRGPVAFGSEHQGSTLASRLSDTQKLRRILTAVIPSRQAGTICSWSEHETNRALDDTVHQDPPAAGRWCTQSISRWRSSVQACRARQLRPADRWRSFHRARRQRSSLRRRRSCGGTSVHPAGVYFPVNSQIKCDWRFQIKCDGIGIGNIIGAEGVGSQRESFGSFRPHIRET